MTEKTPKPRLVSNPFILHALQDILGELKRQTKTREIALSIAKLQEAIFWLEEAINAG